MNKKVILISLIVLVLMLIILFVPFFKEGVPKDYSCKVDSNCIEVTPCCDCNKGGSRASINRDSLDYFRTFVNESSCADIVCTQVISTNPTCNTGLPKCWDGWCSFEGLDPWGSRDGLYPVFQRESLFQRIF